MIGRLVYSYHRLLRIAFPAIVCTSLIKINFPSPHFQRSKLSTMFLLQSESSSLKRANAWLNSPSLTETELKSKVVLIQFCTYTCINWLRTLHYIRAWAGKYKEKELVVIGIHTPEFLLRKKLTTFDETLGIWKLIFRLQSITTRVSGMLSTIIIGLLCA